MLAQHLFLRARARCLTQLTFPEEITIITQKTPKYEEEQKLKGTNDTKLYSKVHAYEKCSLKNSALEKGVSETEKDGESGFAVNGSIDGDLR